MWYIVRLARSRSWLRSICSLACSRAAVNGGERTTDGSERTVKDGTSCRTFRGLDCGRTPPGALGTRIASYECLPLAHHDDDESIVEPSSAPQLCVPSPCWGCSGAGAVGLGPYVSSSLKVP